MQLHCDREGGAHEEDGGRAIADLTRVPRGGAALLRKHWRQLPQHLLGAIPNPIVDADFLHCNDLGREDPCFLRRPGPPMTLRRTLVLQSAIYLEHPSHIVTTQRRVTTVEG